jgi:hypothetical protein
VSQMAQSDYQGAQPILAGRLQPMPQSAYVRLRAGTPRGAKAAAPQMPTLPARRPLTGRAPAGRAAAEPAPRCRPKLLVLSRSGGLRNALCPLSFEAGPSASDCGHALSACRPTRPPLQRVRAADALRTAGSAPVLCNGRRILTAPHFPVSQDFSSAYDGLAGLC